MTFNRRTLKNRANSGPALVCPAASACVPFGFRMNSSFDVGLDLQTTGSRLVVVGDENASLDVRFDLHAASNGLVMVSPPPASLDVGLDLQSTRHRLVMVGPPPASFDVRFDFHIVILHSNLTLNIERRRRFPCFEAEERRSPIHARTGGRIRNAAEILLYASCHGMLAPGGTLARRCA